MNIRATCDGNHSGIANRSDMVFHLVSREIHEFFNAYQRGSNHNWHVIIVVIIIFIITIVIATKDPVKKMAS